MNWCPCHVAYKNVSRAQTPHRTSRVPRGYAVRVQHEESLQQLAWDLGNLRTVEAPGVGTIDEGRLTETLATFSQKRDVEIDAYLLLPDPAISTQQGSRNRSTL